MNSSLRKELLADNTACYLWSSVQLNMSRSLDRKFENYQKSFTFILFYIHNSSYNNRSRLLIKKASLWNVKRAMKDEARSFTSESLSSGEILFFWSIFHKGTKQPIDREILKRFWTEWQNQSMWIRFIIFFIWVSNL